MIKSKAIEILKTFDKREFREFGKFVRSSYFNKKERLIELYSILKNYHPGYSKKNFTKENLHSLLFKKKKYNDSAMRKLLSALQGLASEFIVHSELDKQNNFQRKMILLNGYDERKLDRLYGMNLLSLESTYKQIRDLDDDYFKSNFEIEVSKLNYGLGRGRSGFEPHKVLNELVRCSTYMICYSLITVFKLNQDILVTGVSYDFDYKNTIAYCFIESLGPEKFIGSIKEYAPEFYPAIAIYFNRFMIASGKDESGEYYNELKRLIFKNIDLFSRFEKYNLMLFLENSCDEKILSGKDFRRELHDIQKEMLSKGLYTSEDKDYFPLVRFRKIIRNALSINEFKWTEEFVKNYLDKLPELYRTNMYYYAQANLSFKAGKYDKALEHISKVKFEIYSMKFDVWVFKLCTEFELGYYEQAVYTLDSYKHLLKNDFSTPLWMKRRFQNFVKYFQNILKIKFGKKLAKERIRDMEKEITVCRELLEKQWLLEKISQLEK